MRNGPVGSLLDAAVLERAIPGAVAMVGRGPDTVATYVTGVADTTDGRPMTAGTVFDLASLTKVVATTTAVLALVADGQLGLSAPVRDYLPVAWPSAVNVRHLLTHTAGLPASVTFYQWCDTRAQLLRALYRTPLDASPGTRVVYSDVGFMALGQIVAVVAGEPLDVAVRRLVTGPLRMTSTAFNPSGPAARFAATEVDAAGPPARHVEATAWTGVVHDENARAMDGVAGHAGLFATASDLARFAGWWVSHFVTPGVTPFVTPGVTPSDDGPVPATLRHAAMTCQTEGLPGQDGFPGLRGLGWVCRGDRYDILGDTAGAWPATSVSHTGFTGTSLALDPVSGSWLVLLTNAVHFGRDATAIRTLRRAVHAAAAPPSPSPPPAPPRR
jgi:CubicO group peptidase (beta-lactamase class C family)